MLRPSAKLRSIDCHNIISIEPGKCSGKPCIRGLRITVYDVLFWLADGMSRAEIVEDFPELMDDDITACLQFAAATAYSPIRFLLLKTVQNPLLFVLYGCVLRLMHFHKSLNFFGTRIRLLRTCLDPYKSPLK